MRSRNTIYLDHQATTPVDRRVFGEMAEYFCKLFGNPHSLDHFIGWQASQAVESAAARIAGWVGADADEIIFTSGATEANNHALLGLGRQATGGNRHRVLLSAVEHKCVLEAGRVLRDQYGFSVELIPVNCEGAVDLSALEGILGDDVLLVSVMAVNNEIGTIQDIEAIAHLAWGHGAIFHCDAAQAPVAIDVHGLARNADLMSLSGHKMYGPQGIGVLYARRDLHCRLEPLIYGGGQQNGLRSGTLPVALCAGMAAAAELLGDIEAEQARSRLRGRRDRFVKRLAGLPWETALNGANFEGRHPGNASICFRGFSAEDILQALQPRLAASTGSACTTGIPEPSHVLRAIGLSTEDAEATVRFSLGFDTTDSDVDEAVGLISEALTRLHAI